MKLTVLVDNHTSIDHYYLGEPGLCYYIEDEDSRFLLDTGYSDIYIETPGVSVLIYPILIPSSSPTAITTIPEGFPPILNTLTTRGLKSSPTQRPCLKNSLTAKTSG